MRNHGLWLPALLLTGSLCACSAPAQPSATPVPTHTTQPAPTVTEHGQNEVEDDTWDDAAGAARHAADDMGRAVNGLRRNIDTMVENGKIR